MEPRRRFERRTTLYRRVIIPFNYQGLLLIINDLVQREGFEPSNPREVFYRHPALASCIPSHIGISYGICTHDFSLRGKRLNYLSNETYFFIDGLSHTHSHLSVLQLIYYTDPLEFQLGRSIGVEPMIIPSQGNVIPLHYERHGAGDRS